MAIPPALTQHAQPAAGLAQPAPFTTPAAAPSAAFLPIGPAGAGQASRSAPSQASPEASGAGLETQKREQDLVFEALHQRKLFAQPSPALEILRRGRQEGLSARALGQTILAARSLEELAQDFSARGLIKPGEYQPADPPQADAWRRAVERLWLETSPGLPAAWAVDQGWEVPALVVETPERTYYLHGNAHGFLFPLRAAAVRGLVERLRRGGAALYSEQDYPLHYGYDHGWELKDRDAAPGQPAAVALPRRIPPSARAAAEIFKTAFWTAALALPAAAVFQAPESLLSWAWLALMSALFALAWFAFLPLYRLFFHALGLWARLAGEKDLARLLHARAQALFGRAWNPARLRSLDLPQALKASARPRDFLRSLSQAKAISAHARGLGLREVHVLDGYNHVQDLAWAFGSLEASREVPP